MKSIATKNSLIPNEEPGHSTLSMDSSEAHSLPSAGNTPSINYTKNSVEHLLNLAKEATAKSKGPKAVNAACGCYAQIYKFLRLNFDMMKAVPTPPAAPRAPGALADENVDLSETKLAKVKETLTRFHGNKTQASLSLGISLRTIRNWVHDYDELAEFRNEPAARQGVPDNPFRGDE